MRTSWLASAMFLMAVAGCDDVAVDGPDAMGTDAGADAADTEATAATVTITKAMAPVVAPELQEPPALSDLTWISGRVGMVVGMADGNSTGRIERLGVGDDGAVLLRRAHRATEDERAVIGTAVTLYGVGGAACTANVSALVEVANIVPADGRKHSNRTLWRIAEERSGVNVIAELTVAGCESPIFADEGNVARLAAAPVRAESDRPVATAAMARLRAMPRFANAQSEYLAARYDYDAEHPDWSESAELSVHELALDGKAYVTAVLARDGYCGDFGATIYAIWQRGADGSYHLVFEGDSAPAGYDLAFDDDHDGVPEMAATSAMAPVYEHEELEGCGC